MGRARSDEACGRRRRGGLQRRAVARSGAQTRPIRYAADPVLRDSRTAGGGCDETPDHARVVKEAKFQPAGQPASEAEEFLVSGHGVGIRECALFGPHEWPRLSRPGQSSSDYRPRRLTLLVLASAHSPRKSSLQGSLENAGFRVVTACTHGEALHALSLGVIELTIVDLCHLERESLLTLASLNRRKPFPRMIAISGRSIIPIKSENLAVSRDLLLAAALERHPPVRELVRVVRNTLRQRLSEGEDRAADDMT
jgi:hypothetical protein